MNLPNFTQEPINHVDATPNDEYPLRILKAHRENCNCKWEAVPNDPFVELMNKHCDLRAKLLDRAIEVLERDLIEKRSEN